MVLIWVATLPGTASGAWVGKYEVTQKEFEQVMGANPSKSKSPQQPVERVTWQEAGDFCRKLTASEKEAGSLPQGFVYGLPTRNQWDAFLGNATFDNAVTSRNRERVTPAPVGSVAPPNDYGLCDVLGNVWEWCADADASQRYLKGGAYDSTKVFEWKPLERTTSRSLSADARAPDAGFRCVVVPAP
jgi:formylglycine-generating enzyme required for sulfatase activity